LKRIVEIRFGDYGRTWKYDAGTLFLQKNDKVMVDTESGPVSATIIQPPLEVEDDQVPPEIRKVTRKLTPEDYRRIEKNVEKEGDAYRFCLERIEARELPMKLVRVKFLLDGSKAIFYFTADGRIDFRELVKDLAHRFHTRIEMLQIGVRDESKMLTGFGLCGRPFCCSTWINKFNPVSIKMAKDQNLSLNPSKVSGVCGRLMCCLAYEHKFYVEMKKGMPKCGKRVESPEGPGKVSRLDILSRKVYVNLEDGREVELSPEDIEKPKGQR